MARAPTAAMDTEISVRSRGADAGVRLIGWTRSDVSGRGVPTARSRARCDGSNGRAGCGSVRGARRDRPHLSGSSTSLWYVGTGAAGGISWPSRRRMDRPGPFVRRRRRHEEELAMSFGMNRWSVCARTWLVPAAVGGGAILGTCGVAAGQGTVELTTVRVASGWGVAGMGGSAAGGHGAAVRPRATRIAGGDGSGTAGGPGNQHGIADAVPGDRRAHDRR